MVQTRLPHNIKGEVMVLDDLVNKKGYRAIENKNTERMRRAENERNNDFPQKREKK